MAFSPFHFVLVCQLLLSLPSFGTLAHLVYESKSIAVPLNRVNPDSPPVTFNLNYKRCSTFVTATDSPVLVGVCGQYELDRCWKNMRILEELAPRLNADILYVEHRFYGKSLPEKAFENFDVLQNLRIEEVMDDIREVVKSEHGVEALQRAILVGEDYGGALALWMGMQKDESKAKPFFVWAASPTPLALSPDAPFSNKFDEQLKQLLTSEFGCSWADVDKVFEWMDKTAADDQKGVKAVRDALRYEVADIDIAKIKANVFEWLRQFASWKVRPSYDEATKKFVWPLEEFCSNLKAKNNDEEKAKFYGDFVLKMAGTSATLLDYEVFLYGEKYEHRAKDFQRCTELVTGNCAAEKTKENCQEEMKTNCKDELLRMYAYDPETMFLPNHIAQTFGFDFSKLQNVLVTGEQFDQFGITAISDLASDPKRHVYSFPSIGLSMRGEEVSTPSSCDPLAMREARTQIADILVCLVGPENCVEHPEWPIVLKEETRQEDAKKHQAQCQTRHWQYPWAEYGKEQLTTSTTTTTATSTTTAAPTTTESAENGASHGKTAAAAGLALLMLLATTMGLTL